MDIKKLLSENIISAIDIGLNALDFYDGSYHAISLCDITEEMYERASWKDRAMRGYNKGYIFFNPKTYDVRIGIDVYTDTDFEEWVDFQLDEMERAEFFSELDRMLVNWYGRTFEQIVEDERFKSAMIWVRD